MFCRCLFVCLLATLRKTSERVCMKFSATIGNEPMNKWLNFDGDPDHHLDTRIVFRIRHYWEISVRKLLTDINLLLHPVIHSHRFARWRDWYRDTGKTYLGGGMQCPSVSSWYYFTLSSFTAGLFCMCVLSKENYYSQIQFLAHFSSTKLYDFTA